MTTTTVPTATMNDGVTIPRLGFGVFQVPPDEVVDAVVVAIDAGYRMIDTAAAYDNEEGVGKALSGSGLPREDLFVITKLWNDDHGYSETLRAFDTSAEKLGLDYVDLYLIHWPRPRLNRYVDSWRAMARLAAEGRIRSIGVSNFAPDQIDRLSTEAGVTPSLNQVELHPGLTQDRLRDYHAEHGILTQAWSPLGRNQGLLEHPTVATLARSHERTPAQVVLRWHIQRDVVVIPRSVRAARIRANIEVFDFELDDAEMAALHDIVIPKVGPDPALFFDLS